MTDPDVLTPLALPTSGWAEWLEARVRAALTDAGAGVAAIKSCEAGDAAVLDLWNDVGLALSNAGAVCSLLSAVHPDGAVIELAEGLETELSEFGSDLYLDADVHAALAALDADALDPGARRVLEHTLRAYRRAGVDRDEPTRDRLRTLNRRLTDLGLAFGRNIRDGLRTTQVPASALDGLPEDYVARHPAGADGTVTIDTSYPDTHPFLAFSRDAQARRAVATTFNNLAWPANEPVLDELLSLRHEKATLLGYAGWPDYEVETRMIKRGTAIGEFVDRIAAESEGRARRDLAVLLERAAQDGVETIDVSCARYYTEAVKREQHEVDAQEVRRYLDRTKVHDGLLSVTGRLFGLRYERVEAPVWHADVTSYDVHLAENGELLGRIHLDLHPRERKYNHAAQFTLVDGIAGRQLPEGVLVCNFPEGLMPHADVTTLFHEFGHLLHHVLAGRQTWVDFAGVATEWDFVEAPSQMLEEWAWDADVLATFATDEDGAPIPADLVRRMKAAEDFGRGILARTQMFYAALSYQLHRDRPADTTASLRELAERYSLVQLLPDTHFQGGFGHLNGYGSAYYTYMWSLVIAKDMFSAFDGGDLMAPAVARSYRDAILAPGGSADAADLVESFLGRPYDTRAFTAWLDG